MKTTNFKSIALNVIQLYLVQGLNYILPLLCLPYLLTKLAPNAFGIFTFGQAFVQFIILFVDFGFNLPISKKVALVAENRLEVLKIYKRVIYLKFFLMLIAVGVMLPFVFLLPAVQPYRYAVLISLFSVLGSVFFPLWLFQGIDKLKIYSVINAISRFLTLPLIFIFTKSPDDYFTPSLFYSLALFIAGVFSVIYLYVTSFYKGFKDLIVSFEEMKSEMRESFGIFLSNSAISLYTNGLTLTLGSVASSSIVGLFGALDRFVRMICFSIFVPINQVVFPVIARLGQEMPTQGHKMLKKVIAAIIILMLLIIIFFFLFEHKIIYHFFKSYNNASTYLRIAIFTIFPIGIGGALGQLGLIALGGAKEKRLFSMGYIIVGFVIFPISVLSIFYSPLKGAISGMMAAEFFVFLWMAIAYKKLKRT